MKRLRNNIYYNYLVTLKLQLFTSISAKFGRNGQLNKRIARPWRDQEPEKLMSQPTDHFFNGCSRRQMGNFQDNINDRSSFLFIHGKNVIQTSFLLANLAWKLPFIIEECPCYT